MRICVRLSDPLLSRALVDLLRMRGHDAASLAECEPGCELRIANRAPQTTCHDGHAVLILQRGMDPAADLQPRAALEAALTENGTAVWRAPLDTRLLLDVLDGREGSPGKNLLREASEPPSLAQSPHAWLAIDPHRMIVTAGSDQARDLMGVREDLPGLSLDQAHLPERLREAVLEDSEGLRTTEILGRDHVAAWWTDQHGSRVVCLLEAVPLNTPAARHRQSLAELGRTAATLAHEIRNPVASVAGALDLLESETDPEDRAEVLGMARERLRQMARLLDKTLSLSRPIRGPAEPVELRPAIDSALSNLSMNPIMEHVRIDFDMPGAPVPVSAYEGPLVQAFTNLLLNAAQAQNGRGTIRVSLEVSGTRAVVRIHDEGPGIPPDKRTEIFKPFYTTRPEGTGLGLAEVRRAMQAMGGSVRLDNVERGACFRIDLPLATTG